MIRKRIHKITLTVLILLFVSINTQAQYASEEELKDAANEMFEEENYVGSIKLFSQLLSTYPKDPSYNYKYGACLLFGSRDKDEALRYLKFSVTKSNVDPIAFYFLAKAYHHNYEFSAAIVNYNKYKGKSTVKEHQKYTIDRQLEMCKNGQKLIKSMTDIGVLSKKNIKASDFFRSYKLNGIGGKIIVKPDDFKTKYDQKKKEKSVIYLGEKKDMVVFSSFGKAGASGKDIFRVVKLPNGEWSKPASIGDEINTEYDEDYPFLHPDGRTLYFSSKGYNSMGGYDIFKSTLNPQTGRWSYPENLDFPINTPDDDILYISDIDNKLAYFASSRDSKQGELTVYNVTVNASPVQHSVIKGFFLAESNPRMKSATITVKDVEKDRRYGVYKTHNVTGEYLLTFPSNGGKFKILVETTDDAPVHSAIIELPKLDGFRALKQELRLVGEGDDEKLVIKNLFDETDEFDINDPLFVQNILKERAKLNVNITEEELNNSLANSLNNALSNQENPESAYSELSDEQIVNKTDEVSSKIIEQAKISKEQANLSYQIASKKSIQAKETYNEANILKNNGDLKQAKVKKLEAAKLINEVVAALAIAKTLDNEVVERESDIVAVTKLQEAVNADIDEGNRKGAEDNLEKLDEIASATYHTESALVVEEELLENELSEKQKIYNKNRDNVTELQNREYELTETINKLEAKKEATKKKSEKADLEVRISTLQIDVEDAKFDLTNSKTKAEKSTKEYNEAKNRAKTTKIVIASVTSGNDNVVPIGDASKLQIENDITYFEKEGLVGLYPSNETVISSEPLAVYSLENHKDEYNVIDESGDIVDYNTTYSSELAELDNSITPTEKANQIIKINESWIKDIEEEITIRKEQLKVETNNSKQLDFEGKITSLVALKSEKQNEITTNTELLAANASSTAITTNNSSETIASKEIDEEVNIMNTDGSIIDYESNYTTELELFTEEDDYDSYNKKAAIHTNWASATEQEILIKKMELVEADESEKDGLKNVIAVLENNLLDQQEFAALYESQAESVKVTESVTEEPLANNETSLTNTEDLTLNNNNYKDVFVEELETVSEDDSYESYTEKAIIHKKWLKAIETEIATKEVELSNANEADRNLLENEIAVLENDFLEQGEFIALYESQAESVKVTESVTEEPLANNETSPTNTESLAPNNYKDTFVEELETVSEDDSYESYTEKAIIHKKWSKAIETEIATKEVELSNANEAEKNLLENKIAVLENNLLEQQEFTALYESQAESVKITKTVIEEPIANNEEPGKNVVEPVINNELAEENLTSNNLNASEDDFSNLKYNSEFVYKSTQSQNTLQSVNELKNEARLLKEESDVKLNIASNTSSPEEKDVMITEANDLIKKSDRKQDEIARIYETANRSEYRNNENVISSLKKNSDDPYANKIIMAEMLVDEASNYNEEAKDERLKAINATNQTSKELALQNAYELEMKAIEKQKEAINQLSDGENIDAVYASNEEPANVINNEEPLINTESTTPANRERPSASSSEVTQEDQEVLLNLKPEEIVAIKSSEEYQSYAALKAEKRRLTKEAEVEYVEAQEHEEDASDQKQLGVSLKAMAAGAATEEEKTKKLGQIEKLNKMITENEAKAVELKSSADNKDSQAKIVNDKSDFILINVDENIAKNYTVIEKVETFDSDFMAEVMNRTATSTSEEPLANNE
ncbi:MAG: PD40 domain-containing protein, partial [Flavobacteriales bacterium]|nr:PD40 domain-containing protein [Flavobacteriales bacterium]